MKTNASVAFASCLTLACLLTGCAEATAPVDRGCGTPTDTPAAIAYTRCLEGR